MDKSVENALAYLERNYKDPSSPIAFSSVQNIYRYLRKKGYAITLKDVKKWLSSNVAYTSHRKVVKKFKRPRVVVNGKFYTLATDTAHMEKYKAQNKGYGYFLVIIDVLSRYLFTSPLKSLTGKEIKTAFKELIPRKCQYIWSDDGTEFNNKEVLAYLKSRKITLYSTGHELKSNVAERVIKTVKNKIFKYFTQNQTHKWVDILPQITSAYNDTYHRSLRMSPNDAINTPDATLWRQQYIERMKPLSHVRKYKFNVGHQVKISTLNDKFSREYDVKWTGEYFQIISRRYSQGIPMYKIKSYDNEEIKGSFYEKELQKTNFTDDSVFYIEKIVKRRKKRGVEEGLVKWHLWPMKYNSWLPMSQIKDMSSN